MGMALPYVLSFLGIVVTALVAWFVAKRTTSGSADTTDAATLWDEGSKIRQEAIARANDLQKEVDELRTKIVLVENNYVSQGREMETLRIAYKSVFHNLEMLQEKVDREHALITSIPEISKEEPK